MRRSEAREWAQQDFGNAALGDARRTSRLVRMLARAAENPAGRLSEVYEAKELDAAYDFVENGKVCVARLEDIVGRVTAKHCTRERVRVAIDGSSLSLTRRHKGRARGFGPVGTTSTGRSGLKVISALAMTEDGVPVGLLSQSWWAREERPKRSLKERHRQRRLLKPKDKETSQWLTTIERSCSRLEAVGARGWFQLDREGDSWPVLTTLAGGGHWFTVRSSWDRRLAACGDRQYLRAHVMATKPVASHVVEVPARADRLARQATLDVRAVEVTLLLSKRRADRRPEPFVVRVVSAQERNPPRGAKALNWLLFTNASIATAADARAVIAGYAMRWRIEEFHRTWKAGACDVECTQLRTRDAVIRWATVLGVIAARVEHIKRLGRTEPTRPATDEFSEVEIRVLIALKRRIKKRAEVVPDGVPTIAQAARWLADLGGYLGTSPTRPPGTVPIRRGLERLQHGVEAVLALDK